MVPHTLLLTVPTRLCVTCFWYRYFFLFNRHVHDVQTTLFSHDSIFSSVYAASLSDFVFIQGTGVIFKVALCLLSSHEGEIMECDSFESIVDYLKSTLPALSQSQMEQTITKV